MAVAARGAVREAVVRATSFAQLLAQLRVHRELDHAPANLGELTVVVERQKRQRVELLKRADERRLGAGCGSSRSG